jgi:hypothetical protein
MSSRGGQNAAAEAVDNKLAVARNAIEYRIMAM